MKTLAQEFTRAVDGFKPHTFRLLKRQGNVCLYERFDPNNKTISTLGYEVFVVNVVRENAKYGTPGDEVYPKANSFGKTAYFCTILDRAELRFSELLAKQPPLV